MAEHAIITYETIYEFLRNEKSKEEIQKISEHFFDDISYYLAEKEKIMKSTSEKTDMFSQKELEKIRLQIHNIRAIITDIYTRREKKIIDLAINLVRTRSHIVDTTVLHPKEKFLFDAVVGVLEEHRGTLLQSLLTPREAPKSAAPSDAPHDTETTQERASATQDSGKKVEFLSAIDVFVDGQLNEFGPFSEGDAAVIPSEIADILITEGKARHVVSEQSS